MLFEQNHIAASIIHHTYVDCFDRNIKFGLFDLSGTLTQSPTRALLISTFTEFSNCYNELYHLR